MSNPNLHNHELAQKKLSICLNSMKATHQHSLIDSLTQKVISSKPLPLPSSSPNPSRSEAPRRIIVATDSQKYEGIPQSQRVCKDKADDLGKQTSTP